MSFRRLSKALAKQRPAPRVNPNAHLIQALANERWSVAHISADDLPWIAGEEWYRGPGFYAAHWETDLIEFVRDARTHREAIELALCAFGAVGRLQ